MTLRYLVTYDHHAKLYDYILNKTEHPPIYINTSIYQYRT